LTKIGYPAVFSQIARYPNNRLETAVVQMPCIKAALPV
jgi:hypothetical protein